MINEERNQTITKNLLNWYDRHKRPLPWRLVKDAYRIWLSEIMSQQTRIAAVIPYYEAFLQRFPTVQTLAQAPEQDVLKLWEGLGYYSRARNLHKTAKIVASEFGGEFPRETAVLRTLPGIGPYTAGAIASTAYGICAPAVDGNVLRVVARAEALQDDISLPATKKRVHDIVSNLMPDDRPGDFTQALMELGALVCLPSQADCAVCPIACVCAARQKNCVCELPVKSAKQPPVDVPRLIALFRDPDGRYLLRQRDESLLKNLWEFPGYEQTDHLPDKDFLHITAAKLGLSLQSVTSIGQAMHLFTHRRWKMRGYLCSVDSSSAPTGFFWYPANRLEALPWPTALNYYKNWALGHA